MTETRELRNKLDFLTAKAVHFIKKVCNAYMIAPRGQLSSWPKLQETSPLLMRTHAITDVLQLKFGPTLKLTSQNLIRPKGGATRWFCILQERIVRRARFGSKKAESATTIKLSIFIF